MKTAHLVSAALLALPVIAPPATKAAPPTEAGMGNKPLPKSCTLTSMSVPERAAHLERINRLEKAAQKARTTRQGFTFEVDLQKMSAPDHNAWARAEQGCCSFLRIRVQIVPKDSKALVKIGCPAKMRTEVMQAFGLGS